MDYKCITDKSSAQYKLIYSDEIKVCNDGLLRDDKGYVGVALGSYYADKVGDRFIVTFEDGSKAKFIVLDMKADKDTNGGANHKIDNSMIEFVIDTNMAQQTYPEAIRDGNFNSTNEYDGNIVKIEKVIKNY